MGLCDTRYDLSRVSVKDERKVKVSESNVLSEMGLLSLPTDPPPLTATVLRQALRCSGAAMQYRRVNARLYFLLQDLQQQQPGASRPGR